MNMKIKVLAIGDTANLMTDMKKYFKNIQVNLIDFKERGKNLETDKDTVILEKYNLFKILSKINSIKNDYDFFIVMNWTSAKIAYLAGLNYLIFFVGKDLRKPPFEKIRKAKNSNKLYNFLGYVERKFYKSVMTEAVACVTGGGDLFEILKKYRDDAFRIDHTIVDRDFFKSTSTPINRPKKKFTFFNPQRISYLKGFDIIWKALPLCKSDFEILQVDWFDPELENPHIKKKIISEKPPQVTFIPMMKRYEVVKYYNYCDGVLGNMKQGFIEGIGREGAICKKPVINYINPKYKSVIDGKEIIQPFLPKSNDPAKVAEIIDKIVVSKEFREKLIDMQYSFIEKLTDPIRTIEQWENLVESLLKNKRHTRKQSRIITFFRLVYYLIGRIISK